MAGVFSPMMKRASGVAMRRLRKLRKGRPAMGPVRGGGAAGAGGTRIALSCAVPVWRGSKISRLLAPPALPSVVIRTRPSIPTATPSGCAGRLMVPVTPPRDRSITLSVEVPKLVT